ncbi:MAG: hypothetical protein WDN01_03590 [Rhizomicrobium sp.]
MSANGYSRRAVTVGGGIAAALGIAALGITVPRLFGRQYRKTPYDDLFAQLVDREEAVKVGAAALKTAGPVTPAKLAKELRPRLGQRTLLVAADSDLAEGKLLEVQGWVLPETLVLLCELAALES